MDQADLLREPLILDLARRGLASTPRIVPTPGDLQYPTQQTHPVLGAMLLDEGKPTRFGYFTNVRYFCGGCVK